MNNTVNNDFFGFPKVNWLHPTGEVDKSVLPFWYRYNMLSSMANICCVILIKLNQLVQENAHIITDLPVKRRI